VRSARSEALEASESAGRPTPSWWPPPSLRWTRTRSTFEWRRRGWWRYGSTTSTHLRLRQRIDILMRLNKQVRYALDVARNGAGEPAANSAGALENPEPQQRRLSLTPAEVARIWRC